MQRTLYDTFNALHFEIGLLLQHEDCMNEDILKRLLTEALEGIESGEAEAQGLTEVQRGTET